MAATKKKIRVYKKGGDFVIRVPAEARCTFGYFNPAAAGQNNPYFGQGNGAKTMKMTALRIYADTTDKRQIACFLGVDGFRDETAIDLTQDYGEEMESINLPSGALKEF